MFNKKNKNNNNKVLITKDGPYIVQGNLPLYKEIIISDKEKIAIEWEKGNSYPDQGKCSLCRCGESNNKPYCDGTHSKIGFDGTETASKKKYIEEADVIKGPEINLTDLQDLCAGARFCDYSDGVWVLTKNSNNKKSKELAIREACDCPAGRLVTWDKKTGEPIEPMFDLSISIIEDPALNVSGPIWLKGGIPIVSFDGTQYEIRNRVTLCRCGKSNNKPFCDSKHILTGFSDGDDSLKK